ncbi:FimV/HubP family polar landmark protein [Piscirickettsia litoralis]|uniref:FimV/HubP family polar landmark protein n=1 Tax=Piscirickettsia litoralis TaxID=1891921 RepID=UPI001F2702B7|nr:FimV/HubP family polar landmark protein [Piscirickettsia litoralis]
MSLYGPIRSHDTLWKVAQRIRPSKNLTVQQTMVALLEQNPRAFIAGDMNEIQRGQVLFVPSKKCDCRHFKTGCAPCCTTAD